MTYAPGQESKAYTYWGKTDSGVQWKIKNITKD